MLESVNKTLIPLMEFTNALSGEECLYVKPVLHLPNNTVLRSVDDDTGTWRRRRRGYPHLFKWKYSDPVTDDLLDIASFVYIADYQREFILSKAETEIQAPLETQESSPTHTSAGPTGENQREPKKSKISQGSF